MSLNPPQLNPLLTFPDNSQLAAMSIDGIVIDRVYGATGVLDTLQNTTAAQYQDPNSNQINPPFQTSLQNQGNNTVWYSTLVDDAYNTGFALAFQFNKVTYINYITFDILNVPCSWSLLQVSGAYSPLIGGVQLAQGIVNGTNSQGWINFEETLAETYEFNSNTTLVLVINKLPTGTQYQLGVQNFLSKLVVRTISDLELNGTLINNFVTQNNFGFIETFTPNIYSYPSNASYDALVTSLLPSAWWKLNDPIGSTTVADSSGNGYNGTVTGGVTFGQPGAISGTPSDTAALFDGSTGYIGTTYVSPSGTTVISAAIIYKTTGAAATQQMASSYGGGGAGLSMTINAGTLNCGVFTAGGVGASITNPVATNDGHYHHAVVTWDGTTVSVYSDGEILGTAPLSGSFSGASPAMQLAVLVNSGVQFFSGELTEAVIFPTALTAAQVLALYNAASIPSISPSPYWKCSPQPVKDAVVWFTLDLGQTQVINRMYVDPLYTGCSFNLYWSCDNINWTPINQDLTLHKGIYKLNPICARYLKLEFSQLVPEVYDLPFESINRAIQVFPDYIDTYFLGLEQALLDAPAQTYNNLVGNSPNVLYNTSPSITSNYGALAGQLTSNQYGGSSTNLGLANLGANNSNYSVVDPTVSYKNLQNVANEGSIFSNVGDTPFMNRRFYQSGQHTYKEVLINQTWHQAYFVGIKYLSFYNKKEIGFPQ